MLEQFSFLDEHCFTDGSKKYVSVLISSLKKQKSELDSSSKISIEKTTEDKVVMTVPSR
ncbi:hypothetical protein D3C81_1167220 [compost metagenome]